MTEEITVPHDKSVVKEFEHPNGETGILIALTTDAAYLADTFDLPIDVDGGTIVIPFKHKADGATNFREYRVEGDDLVIVFDDDHYAQIRDYLETALRQ